MSNLELPPPGILVTDDEAAVRGLLAAFLRHKGYAVWTAADGREAVALYAAHRGEIDLVLLDVRLPDPDGPAILSALKQLDPAVRCCFMTGASGEYSHDDLIRFGALDVFPKPFLSLEAIAQRLRHCARTAV